MVNLASPGGVSWAPRLDMALDGPERHAAARHARPHLITRAARRTALSVQSGAAAAARHAVAFLAGALTMLVGLSAYLLAGAR